MQKRPSYDLIVAVKDLKSFHKENMAMNKNHYTYMARMTHGKVVYLAQERAARIHFNHMSLKDMAELTDEAHDPDKLVNFRYGVIELEDMLRDLQHWETLMVSTFMQRPFETINKGEHYD
jgi:hypothetical protein